MGNQAHRPALILVKHGQPAIVPDVPRSLWALSDEGRMAASRLAGKLTGFDPQFLFASPELKAHDTAAAMGEVLGLPVRTDLDLAEHRADHNPFVSQAEIEALIEQALREPDRLVLGEETGAAARQRFARAMTRVATAGSGTKVVVAHGRIISLWLSARLAIDPVPFWRRLGFASGAVLSESDGTFEMVDA
ncbi:MAG: histidine phosphatase family protein [Phenylobacterium sp.]|uniref:histidine phosphatase family protein n=1 Tax=Phenylobacterium sp. TaxID=1871053 RepID=UPI003BB687F6